ncbi:J domain-containing protein [uncultured Shimia sp.]|uniref:J domain-containing protein n=1 Tax=uncultured Shimia sp. TaxID=573152 RepID=UPI00262B9C03|nr:J domain-containing protein [uncultured Shimia sp.]
MKKEIAQAYKILGVSPEVSDKEMRTAWRKLVRSYHPDLARSDPEEASRRMGEINAAYDAVAHHRLKKAEQPRPKRRRHPRQQTAQTTKNARPDAQRARTGHTRTANSATRKAKPSQTAPNAPLLKRRTYRSPQEQRLIDAACAVFEETRRNLSAASRQPAFSTCR